jgi:hypothetical protein
MRALDSYDYATIRVVPRVDREEFVNAGVVVFCLARDFLGARVHVDEQRLRVLAPDIDVPLVRRHVDAIARICAGDEDAGSIAMLSKRERFHWLVAPRSTIVQVSSVHSGMCESPEKALAELFRQLVLVPKATGA